MINYKRIKIFRLLYGATIVTALVMGIAIARESYVWPLIGFIASIIAFIAYSDALLRCPHCHSRKSNGHGKNTGHQAGLRVLLPHVRRTH